MSAPIREHMPLDPDRAPRRRKLIRAFGMLRAGSRFAHEGERWVKRPTFRGTDGLDFNATGPGGAMAFFCGEMPVEVEG